VLKLECDPIGVGKTFPLDVRGSSSGRYDVLVNDVMFLRISDLSFPFFFFLSSSSLRMEDGGNVPKLRDFDRCDRLASSSESVTRPC
jgi:hypothetical protein